LIDLALLAANVGAVRRQVDAACEAAGRDPADVSILPVSKTFSADTVRAAVSLGMHRFGENKVQEIRDKTAALCDLSLQWVVIGHLQTNKAKDVARLAHEVQSLDRLELAQALHHRLEVENRELDVLVQVKTASEESKSGLPPEQLGGLLKALQAFPRLHVKGLMTLATHSGDAHEVRGCFRQLRQLRDEYGTQGYELPRLSMGMSSDFALAIAEGATEVRIGSAIFGDRAYPIGPDA
jgi:pyridoxal phosphate enzyme (YggS family)